MSSVREELDKLAAQQRAAAIACDQLQRIVPNPSSAGRAVEIRITDPTTGGMKGSKQERFDMIPADVLWELAAHYGKGEAKYPSDLTGLPNWQRGYSWRLSVAAMQRHFHQWLQGEETDEETGSAHLVAAIWHLMALRWFERHGKGTDFRAVQRG